MVFYNATNKSGICQKIDRLCDSDDDNYTRVEKTSEVNEAFKELVAEIINADGTWQYDDTNQTDLPVGTGDLVASQSKYSFASDYLQVLAIKVKDDAGDWHKLKPIDQADLEYAIEEFLEQDGLPQYYDKVGDSIRLYPAPSADDVTLTAGLKIEFKRNPVEFTFATDTSADNTEPGLAVNHQILAYMASIPWCEKYHPDRVPLYERKIANLKDGIIKHYSYREKDLRTIIQTKRRCYK